MTQIVGEVKPLPMIVNTVFIDVYLDFLPGIAHTTPQRDTERANLVKTRDAKERVLI